MADEALSELSLLLAVPLKDAKGDSELNDLSLLHWARAVPIAMGDSELGSLNFEEHRVVSRDQIALNIVAAICFPLGVPYVFGQTGWWFGMTCLISLACSGYVSSVLLGDICIRRPDLRSYPEIAGAAWGRKGSILILVIQCGGTYFAAVYYFVMLGEYMSVLSPDHAICQQKWIYVIAVVALALGQIPTWGGLTFLTKVFLFINLFAIFFLVDSSAKDRYCDVEYNDISFFGSINGLTAMALCVRVVRAACFF